MKLFFKCGRPMYVTENGIADSEDKLRPQFASAHLRQLHRVVYEEKLDVGYHWAMIGNYEWADGFTKRLGLYAVDLTV